MPLHLAFTFRDLVERLNAARYEVVDLGADRAYVLHNGMFVLGKRIRHSERPQSQRAYLGMWTMADAEKLSSRLPGKPILVALGVYRKQSGPAPD